MNFISLENLYAQTNSQAGQDLFVIAMLNGKHNGTFLEIGCAHPHRGSNTYMLEKLFGFSGVSMDLYYKENEQDVKWSELRPHSRYLSACDATTFDYSKLEKYYDYLQVDIDPPVQSFTALKRILPQQRFAVITFEHDVWDETSQSAEVQAESRKLLQSNGYELIVNNVTLNPGKGRSIGDKPIYFEDWYVDPNIVSREIIEKYKWVDDGTSSKYRWDILHKNKATKL